MAAGNFIGKNIKLKHVEHLPRGSHSGSFLQDTWTAVILESKNKR